MRFNELKPRFEGAETRCKPGAPVWALTFNCPSCGTRTGIDVSGRVASAPTWQIKPEPLGLLGSIQSGDYDAQWAAIWDGVSIEPSMQQLPHPRQITCNAHFTVTKGDVTKH